MRQKHHNIFLHYLYEHMILGQLRMGARQAKNAPLRGACLYYTSTWGALLFSICTASLLQDWDEIENGEQHHLGLVEMVDR